MLRPQITPPYIPLTIPGKQAEAIVSEIIDFFPRRGYLVNFDETVSHLVSEASSNQFENSLQSLGSILGFITERPDKIYNVGPDVLWILTEKIALVIEAKSRKNKNNALTKEQHGQLLNASEWFKESYPNHEHIRVSVHPNCNVTKSTITGESKVLTLDNLNQLIADTRSLLTKLCESAVSHDELIFRCENLLSESTLNPTSLINKYFVDFKSEKS